MSRLRYFPRDRMCSGPPLKWGSFMATTIPRRRAASDNVKYGFFVLLALSVPLVLWADERFLVNPADPHWKHIAPFKWLLLVHGLAGLTALTSGTVQMSSRLRRQRPAVHRAVGRVFLGAVTIAAPAALAITLAGFEPRSIVVEQWFQAGGWLVSPWVAYACIRFGQVPLHKAWMMRSYAFTLIFILSRVPDFFFPTYSDQALSDMLWGMVVGAAVAPELILTTQTLWRIRSAKVRHAAAAAAERG
jgi:uncharacterized membrane protein